MVSTLFWQLFKFCRNYMVNEINLDRIQWTFLQNIFLYFIFGEQIPMYICLILCKTEFIHAVMGYVEFTAHNTFLLFKVPISIYKYTIIIMHNFFFPHWSPPINIKSFFSAYNRPHVKLQYYSRVFIIYLGV